MWEIKFAFKSLCVCVWESTILMVVLKRSDLALKNVNSHIYCQWIAQIFLLFKTANNAVVYASIWPVVMNAPQEYNYPINMNMSEGHKECLLDKCKQCYSKIHNVFTCWVYHLKKVKMEWRKFLFYLWLSAEHTALSLTSEEQSLIIRKHQ